MSRGSKSPASALHPGKAGPEAALGSEEAEPAEPARRLPREAEEAEPPENVVKADDRWSAPGWSSAGEASTVHRLEGVGPQCGGR